MRRQLNGELASAIERAEGWLVEQARTGLPEAEHVMRFPVWAGFSGPDEEHVAETFARAVVAGLLLDAAGSRPGSALAEVAATTGRAVADRIAAMRSEGRRGGWSYFPTLAELPPDLDSLAVAVDLFTRVAPEYRDLCREPIDLALEAAGPDPCPPTWLIAPDDAERAVMTEGVERFWGSSRDLGVCARFWRSLLRLDAGRYRAGAVRAARGLAAAQDADGGWRATWYWGSASGTGLCLEFLRAVGGEREAVDRAEAFLWTEQRIDGGWGEPGCTPHDTAFALAALGADALAGQPAETEAAVAFLLDYQSKKGSWQGTAWIQMPVGRAQGEPVRVATYASDTVTTAAALRALVLVDDAAAGTGAS